MHLVLTTNDRYLTTASAAALPPSYTTRWVTVPKKKTGTSLPTTMAQCPDRRRNSLLRPPGHLRMQHQEHRHARLRRQSRGQHLYHRLQPITPRPCTQGARHARQASHSLRIHPRQSYDRLLVQRVSLGPPLTKGPCQLRRRATALRRTDICRVTPLILLMQQTTADAVRLSLTESGKGLVWRRRGPQRYWIAKSISQLGRQTADSQSVHLQVLLRDWTTP